MHSQTKKTMSSEQFVVDIISKCCRSELLYVIFSLTNTITRELNQMINNRFISIVFFLKMVKVSTNIDLK